MGVPRTPSRTVLFERERTGLTYRVPSLLPVPPGPTLLAFVEQRLSPDDSHAHRLVLRRGTLAGGSVRTGPHLPWVPATACSCPQAACWYPPTPTAWTAESVLARSAGPALTPSPSTAMTTAAPGAVEASCPTCAQASASWRRWTVGRPAASSTAMPGAHWAAVCRRSALTRAPPSCPQSAWLPCPRLPGAARAASWASQPPPPTGHGMTVGQWAP
ncbi:NEU4 isoform 2, partial [Pan troglodytes]